MILYQMKTVKNYTSPIANAVIYCKAFDLVDKTGIALMGKVVRFFINELYLKLMQTYPNVDEIKMHYFIFLYEIQNQRSQALVEIRKIHKNSLALHDQYLVYRSK